MSRFDFRDRDDYLDFRHEMLTGSEECHADCGDYGPCACGPCERCDDEGYIEGQIGGDDNGWGAAAAIMDVPMVCPTCNGTKIDPEALA